MNKIEIKDGLLITLSRAETIQLKQNAMGEWGIMIAPKPKGLQSNFIQYESETAAKQMYIKIHRALFGASHDEPEGV